MPSHLLSLDEELLSQSFMHFVHTCFLRDVPKSYQKNNPILSPLQCCDALLKEFPPVEFLVAENDCLRDQYFEMAMRFLKMEKHCKLHMMREFVHGFHNMDVKIGGVDEFKRSTKHIIEMFKGLNELI